MKNVMVAFNILSHAESLPIGFSEVGVRLIFTIKLEDFSRKARLVARGDKTSVPASLTYASVVSRESVRIALTVAALNDLDVMSADIKNAYVQAPNLERRWCVCGDEFGTDSGKRAVIIRALYGLKSAGQAFRNHLAACMRELGYEPCWADRDVWMKAGNRTDGSKHYQYVLLYVDDALAIGDDPKKMLLDIDKYFPMKSGSIGPPDFYLGSKMSRVKMENGVESWSFSASKYVQEACNSAKKQILARDPENKMIERNAKTPMSVDYRPELDESEELDEDGITLYQSLIGVLRWIVELGRIDIMTELSMLSSHLAMPREGHLQGAIRIFSYLRGKHNARMPFDPSYPQLDLSTFKRCDWKDFYPGAEEALPPNAPEPRGKGVELRLYTDSDHAGCRVTRRSRTGFFIFINSAPIIWYSKRQPTLESAVFGSEFVAMKTGMETARGLRYKLRMMGIPILGPTYTYADNMSVIYNTQSPESTLKKKSNSICYHAIREAIAGGELLTSHISTHDNPADIGTKVLPNSEKRNKFIGMFLFDIVRKVYQLQRVQKGKRQSKT